MNLILTKNDKTVAIIDHIDLYDMDEIAKIIKFEAKLYGRNWRIEGDNKK